MSDVVPHDPINGTPIKVSLGANHAFWGGLFNDEQVAAVVAVDLTRAKDHEPGDNADLCLLLWDHGWQFTQLVGKVAATVDYENRWDWSVERRALTGTWYVVSHLNLYPAGEHSSWVCDAKTHTLIPTGWPKNAVPSMSRDTVTFTRQDKPGFSEIIRDIYRFTDRPAKRLATVTDAANTKDGEAVLTVCGSEAEGGCTWRIRKLPGNGRYAICRAWSEVLPTRAFRQDAVAEVDYGDVGGVNAATDFIWQRLSGITVNALEGDWDRRGESDPPIPRKVTVTGLPEAVRLLSWPVEGEK